ncbi:hypothetical protein ACJJTC_015523 [Scirpophaga incertulas]
MEGGCVNKAFEGTDDGFQTIDLRTSRPDEQERVRMSGPEPEAESPEGTAGRPVECGWGVFRPKWLQRFRTAKWALFWLCWAGAIQAYDLYRGDIACALRCYSTELKANTLTKLMLELHYYALNEKVSFNYTSHSTLVQQVLLAVITDHPSNYFVMLVVIAPYFNNEVKHTY